jgi:lysine 2,3-aminomutase
MVGGNGKGLLPEAALTAILGYIAARPQIREVILTGGDPLVLSARRIADITQRLSGISHLSVIRWHTRVPVVDPKRMTSAMLRALSTTDKAVFVAIHANHPSEFTPQAAHALRTMRRAGLTLLSQSVLLRGVNDEIDILEALMRAFLAHGVKPYYLHHPDLAPGTGHFRLLFRRGLALMAALKDRLSGIGQPAYIIDAPGGAGKQSVEAALRDVPPGHIRTRDGRLIAHPDAEAD